MSIVRSGPFHQSSIIYCFTSSVIIRIHNWFNTVICHWHWFGVMRSGRERIIVHQSLCCAWYDQNIRFLQTNNSLSSRRRHTHTHNINIFFFSFCVLINRLFDWSTDTCVWALEGERGREFHAFFVLVSINWVQLNSEQLHHIRHLSTHVYIYSYVCKYTKYESDIIIIIPYKLW